MLSAGSPNPRVPLSALLRPEPFPQPPWAAPRLRPPQAGPAALAAASRPLWKGWGEAGVARGGPRHLPSPSWSHPRPPQLPEGGKHWPLLPWRSSPGTGLLWVVLGEQSASQAAPRSDPPLSWTTGADRRLGSAQLSRRLFSFSAFFTFLCTRHLWVSFWSLANYSLFIISLIILAWTFTGRTFRLRYQPSGETPPALSSHSLKAVPFWVRCT